jgi:hypothetical protein
LLPVHPREIYIYDCHDRLRRPDNVQRLFTVRGLRNHLQIRLQRERISNSLPEKWVVIDNYDGNFIHPALACSFFVEGESFLTAFVHLSRKAALPQPLRIPSVLCKKIVRHSTMESIA